jgi:hypothetical protein
MRYLIADALRLWTGISNEALPSAVDMGIKASGGFQSTAGGVAKAWEQRAVSKTLELGQSKLSGAEALEEARAWTNYWESLSPEEQEAERQDYRAFWRDMQKAVGGAG